uniref:Uncharacterized protein n=1 Tax=Pipistrellus kuhlii TaxID=59472 RepID=A0A7J8A829_PIPKU|nr:hypothetical protein mPipKuh1_009026 [Pipistrellus kuhlii]
MRVARLGETKQEAREGLDRDRLRSNPCPFCSEALCTGFGREKGFLLIMGLGVGGLFGSLPEDLTLPLVLRHREETVLVSDSRLVRRQSLVCGVCTAWSVHVCACVSPRWPPWACVSASPPCSLLPTQTTFTFY